MGIPPPYFTKPTRSIQTCISLGSLKQVPALTGGGKGRNVTSAEWQVALCDPYGTWVPVAVRLVAHCHMHLSFTLTSDQQEMNHHKHQSCLSWSYLHVRSAPLCSNGVWGYSSAAQGFCTISGYLLLTPLCRSFSKMSPSLKKCSWHSAHPSTLIKHCAEHLAEQ